MSLLNFNPGGLKLKFIWISHLLRCGDACTAYTFWWLQLFELYCKWTLTFSLCISFHIFFSFYLIFWIIYFYLSHCAVDSCRKPAAVLRVSCSPVYRRHIGTVWWWSSAPGGTLQGTAYMRPGDPRPAPRWDGTVPWSSSPPQSWNAKGEEGDGGKGQRATVNEAKCTMK